MGWEADLPDDGLDFEDLVKKREEQKLQPASPTVAGLGEKYDPFLAFGQTVESPASALSKPQPGRPEGWGALVDPQQYKESVRGIPGGAVSFVGTGLQGLGAVPARGAAAVFQFGKDQQALWERIDRGERIPETDDAAGYQHMNPEQRRSLRADAAKVAEGFRPTPLAEQPLYKAGESVKEYAKGILPAAPGYEDAAGRQIGEGLGSLIAGLPFGIAGRIPATIFFGAGGAGEAGTRAIAFDQAEKRAGRAGLSQDQINTAALYGVGPGTTDLLPVEVLLGRLRIPAPLQKPLAAAIGRIGGQAFIEGVQEGGQAYLQNFIAKEVYNPQQGLTEGLGGEAAVGGAVGGVAQTVKELAAMALRGFSGRRGGQQAQPGTDPFAQPLTPAPAGPSVAMPPNQPIDVDFEDLIPAERRLSPPQQPAPPAGTEPPSSPPALPYDPAERPPVQPGSEVSPADETALAPSQTPIDALGQGQDARRGVDVLQFIRANGGLKPSQELRAFDANRYPGLINRNGLDADKMREKMVEAGYLQESGPDQPATSTPADVYDMLGRAISGERIVPAADSQGNQAFRDQRAAKDARRELRGAERTFVQPEIAQYDAEIGGNGELWKAYLELSQSDRDDVIDRNRRGADIVDLLEEKTLQNPMYYALGAPIRKAKAARDNLGFYSKALESAKALPQEKGTSQQMLAMLRTAGVKEAEIKATGLNRFLAERPSVTKQEITEFLGKNRIVLKESTYAPLSQKSNSSSKYAIPEVMRAAARSGDTPGDLALTLANDGDAYRAIMRRFPELRENEDWEEVVATDVFGGMSKPAGSAKWERYSLDPGNPTYRESVIHLPGSGKMPPYEEWLNNRRSWGAQHEDTPGARAEYAEKVSNGYATPEDYTSGHWDEPNIVAHTRTQILTDTKGRKVSNIDELQSDWGQGIREGGGRDEEKIAKLKKDIEAASPALETARDNARDFIAANLELFKEAEAAAIKRGFLPAKTSKDRMNYLAGHKDASAEVRSQAIKLRDKIDDVQQGINLKTAELKTAEAATPSHSLVNTTDQWVTTAMRRLIQQAVDAGADGMTITPGKVQAKRFDLSDAISSVTVVPYEDGTRDVNLYQRARTVATLQVDPKGTLVADNDTPADWVGKTLADAIGQGPASAIMGVPYSPFNMERGVDIAVEDLTVGGEGMKATYDGIYPRTLLKLLQKLDPSIRPEKTRLFPSDYTPRQGSDHSLYYDYAKGTPFENEFIYFPLTEKAKAKLAKEGQPMFAIGAPNAKGRKRDRDGGGRTESGSLAPLKGAPTVDGASGPDPRVVAAAEQYAESIGIDLKRQAEFAQVDEKLATRIAAAYEAMPHTPNDPKVRAAYDDMVVQTVNQYRALERAGYKFWLYDETNDPYAGNPWNSIRDLRSNQRMGVFATEAGFGSGVTPELNVEDSPMLADSGIRWPYGGPNGPLKRVLVNDLFRAVHDVFGHSIEGAGFRARGEENAWQAHIRLYTGLAQGAVTTETRGQNSWLNYGPYGEANRNASVEDTVFADQKLGLMPEWSWLEGRVGDDVDERYAVGLNFGKPLLRGKRVTKPRGIDANELRELTYEIYDGLKNEAIDEHMREWASTHNPAENYDIKVFQREFEEGEEEAIEAAKLQLVDAEGLWFKQLMLPGFEKSEFPELEDFLPEEFLPKNILPYWWYRLEAGTYHLDSIDSEDNNEFFWTETEARGAAEDKLEELKEEYSDKYDSKRSDYEDNGDFDQLYYQAKEQATERLAKEALEAKEEEQEEVLRSRYSWASTDSEIRRQIDESLGRGEAFTVPKAIRDALRRAMEPAMVAVPEGHYVGTVSAIEPIFLGYAETQDAVAQRMYRRDYAALSMEARNLVNEEVRETRANVVKDRVRLIFADANGREREMEGDLDTLLGVRAFYVQSGTTPSLLFTRLDLAGNFHKTLRGELRHEVAHALRIQGRIDPFSWNSLLRHADGLRVMDIGVKDYLTMIGHPMAADAEPGVSLRQAYEEAYEGRSDLEELLDQEAVAHLVELFSHGAVPSDADFAHEQQILQDLIDGDYSKRSPWAKVDSHFDKKLTPKVRQLLQEQIDVIRKEYDEELELYAGVSSADVADQGGQPATGPIRREPIRGAPEGEITPGAEEFARSSRIGESFNRRSIAGQLRNAALDRYLGGWFSPQASRLRAEMQGFTWEAWHGTKSPDFLVPKRYVEGKDYGFHMAINRPEAANERLHMAAKQSQYIPTSADPVGWIGGDNANIMKLLVRAEKPFRVPDLGSWVQPSKWAEINQSYETNYSNHPDFADPEAKKVAIELAELARGKHNRAMLLSGESLATWHDDFAKLLESYGFDSIIYKNTAEDEGNDSLFVWDGARVRSAHDLFDPRALGQVGLFASTPFLEADLRQRLNEAAIEEGLAIGALFGLAGAHKTRIDSPAFRNWFGDSKVVDEDGDPRVMYHGSRHNIEAFSIKKGSDLRRGASWFTTVAPYAGWYAGWGESGQSDTAGPVYPVYLSIENPADVGVVDRYVSFEEFKDIFNLPRELSDQIRPGGGMEYSENPVFVQYSSSPNISEILKKGGYDGITAIEGRRKSRTFAVFSPEQVKSVFNRGSFSPGEPHISYALGGKRAIGAPQGAFSAAERMEGQGRGADAIWQATGTFRGPDAKWRWEIDDSGARITNLDKILASAKGGGNSFMGKLWRTSAATAKGEQKVTNVPLLNLLDHPKLFNAYPFLRQMRVDLTVGPRVASEGALRVSDTAKGKVYKPIRVKARNPEEVKSVLLHEIQHYIQEREGFAQGASPKDQSKTKFGEGGGAVYDPSRNTESQDVWWRSRHGNNIVEPTSVEQHALFILEAFEELDAAEKSGDVSAAKKAKNWLEHHGEALERAMLVAPSDYTRSAGEAEAREVQERMNLGVAQRRAKRPMANLSKDTIVSTTATTDYDAAYDEALRRAQVWKDIKDNWKTAKPVGAGVFVVRPMENTLFYGEGPSKPFMEVSGHPFIGTASVSLHPAFYSQPYPRQREIADAALKDMRQRNMHPSVGRGISDEDVDFWAKYNPRLVAFEPRLYRKEIEEVAKERYGPDATIEFTDQSEVLVNSNQVRIDNATLQKEAIKADEQVGKIMDSMHKKYGDDFRAQMTPEEERKLYEASVKSDELSDRLYAEDPGSDYTTMDTDWVFEGRSTFLRPEGVDTEAYRELLLDEQLDRWGKLPRPGDDVDFSDLVMSQ